MWRTTRKTSSRSTACAWKRQPARIVLMLNKPRGYVCTLQDEKGQKMLQSWASPAAARLQVYPVGRLDLNSKGLLLLTNDGELANRLTHPKKGVDKGLPRLWLSITYRAARRPLPAPSKLTADRRTAKVEKLRQEGETALLRITIHEGTNRQIRRLCERANVTVTSLRRGRRSAHTRGTEARAVAQAHTGRGVPDFLTPELRWQLHLSAKNYTFAKKIRKPCIMVQGLFLYAPRKIFPGTENWHE